MADTKCMMSFWPDMTWQKSTPISYWPGGGGRGSVGGWVHNVWVTQQKWSYFVTSKFLTNRISFFPYKLREIQDGGYKMYDVILARYDVITATWFELNRNHALLIWLAFIIFKIRESNVSRKSRTKCLWSQLLKSCKILFAQTQYLEQNL